MARRASAIKDIRRGDTITVVLDGGDSLLPTHVRQLTPEARAKAETMLRGQAMMGYDAMAVGEGELLLGIPWLKKVARQTSQKLICANIKQRGRAPFAPRVMLKRGELKLGITAVLELPAGAVRQADQLKKAGIRLANPEAAIKEQIAALKGEGADLLILIAHTGVLRAQQLAQKFPELHSVLVAHGGGVMAKQEGPVMMGEPGRRGQNLLQMELRLGEGWGVGSRIENDSRRHTLYREIQHELLQIKGKKIKPDDVRVVRARALGEQLAKSKAPRGPHTAIANNILLDEAISSDPALERLVEQQRPSWQLPPPGKRPPRASAAPPGRGARRLR